MLIERQVAYKHLVKDLMAYTEAFCKMQKNIQKETEKVSKVS